jgi:small subunit ribosomal protein S5
MMADETTEVQGTEVQAGNPAVVDAPAPDQQQQQRGRGGRGGGGGGGRGGGDNRGRGGRDGNRGRRDNNRGGSDDGGEELIEKLVHINRVSKTVKGGKRFGFRCARGCRATARAGPASATGKAREVPEAITKATAAAKRGMVRVPLKEGRTLHHDGKGHFGLGNVHVRTRSAGTGIIAGGPMRAVFESLGVADVVTKSVGTSNPYNMIRATFEALGDQTSPSRWRSAAARRSPT